MERVLQTTRTKGGNYHPIATKDFVIGHLSAVGEDYPANIHRAYVEALKILAEQKGRPKPYHKCHYSSFIVSFNNLVREGLVVFSGREERSDDPRAQANKIIPLRKYFRIAGPGSNGHQANARVKIASDTRNGHKPASELGKVLKVKTQFGKNGRSNGLKSP